MRVKSVAFLIVSLLVGGGVYAQETEVRPVGTISELMIEIIYPLSDELFYIMRNPPDTALEWTALRRSALTLAESGNLLMLEGRAIPQEEWAVAARRLVDVSTMAYEATKAEDLQAILDLSAELEASCRGCHEQYHPRYRRRPAP